MSRAAAFLAFTFLLAVPLAAQPAATSYLPMGLENWWRLGAIDDSRPDAPLDTFLIGTRRFTEALTVNGTEYYRISSAFIDSDTLRSDGAGRVWSYARGEERLLFDFTAGDDSVYTYATTYAPGDTGAYVVRVIREQTVSTYVGVFEHCITFMFDVPEYIDDELSYTFAPGIGLVRVAGAWVYGLLFEARVGGVAYVTAVDETPGPPHDAPRLALYPNPSPGDAWLEVELEAPGALEVSIYDLLGRRVESVWSGAVGRGTHRYRINTGGLAASTYFIRVNRDQTEHYTLLLNRF